jgi:ABC-type enterochelin transport system substrate-binding protein
MRLAVFGPEGRVGVVRDDVVVDVSAAYATYLAETTGEPVSAEPVCRPSLGRSSLPGRPR